MCVCVKMAVAHIKNTTEKLLYSALIEKPKLEREMNAQRNYRRVKVREGKRQVCMIEVLSMT